VAVVEIAPAILASYDFAHFGTLVLAATPGLRGVLFDTPPGLAEARDRLAAAGVEDRCEVVAGDFFVSVPDGADAYLMKSVICDWDDERCVTILENCRQAMVDGGKVLILEPVLPPVVKPSFARLGIVMSDLNMLLNTGGRERTEDEFASLLRATSSGELRDHALAEELDRAHDLVVRDLVRVHETEQQVATGRLVALGDLDAPVGVADHRRPALAQVLEVEVVE
jgi:hypothetical protein